ncbi:MAG TPA: ribosome-associated translation inhibitor RaiA [Thermodesulfobacteriota bacterium]|nr:ribosome-associated translation inhibitor RaiA [Thermodesulfobacteriota bacterium]
MQVAVTFRHMKTHEGVKAYVKEKVEKLRKYVENPREVHVVLAVEKFRHIAEITVVGDGGIFNSQGRDNDLYAAIDQMVDKMERQVRERREKARQKRAGASSPKVLLPRRRKAGEENEEGDLSSLVQRRRTVAKPMSLEEALSQLALSKKDLLVFVNSDSGQMNAVCRSKNGGYEWVEPYLK